MNEDLATGEKTNVYKGVAVGFITYGADGRIMAIVVDSGRKKPAGSVVTGPEAEALFRTMTAYAGSYTMKDGQISTTWTHPGTRPGPARIKFATTNSMATA